VLLLDREHRQLVAAAGLALGVLALLVLAVAVVTHFRRARRL